MVVGAKDGVNYKSTLTVDKASQSQAGRFYCVATYTEPSYLQISKKADARALTVVGELECFTGRIVMTS